MHIPANLVVPDTSIHKQVSPENNSCHSKKERIPIDMHTTKLFPFKQPARSACLSSTYIHVKTRKFLQVCMQVVTNLFTSCQQVVFALLVPTVVCCNKFGQVC